MYTYCSYTFYTLYITFAVKAQDNGLRKISIKWKRTKTLYVYTFISLISECGLLKLANSYRLCFLSIALFCEISFTLFFLLLFFQYRSWFFFRLCQALLYGMHSINRLIT